MRRAGNAALSVGRVVQEDAAGIIGVCAAGQMHARRSKKLQWRTGTLACPFFILLRSETLSLRSPLLRQRRFGGPAPSRGEALRIEVAGFNYSFDAVPAMPGEAVQ